MEGAILAGKLAARVVSKGEVPCKARASRGVGGWLGRGWGGGGWGWGGGVQWLRPVYWCVKELEGELWALWGLCLDLLRGDQSSSEVGFPGLSEFQVPIHPPRPVGLVREVSMRRLLHIPLVRFFGGFKEPNGKQGPL